MDRYVEANDNKIEDWAQEQDKADMEEMEKFNKAQEEIKQEEEKQKMEEIKKRLQEEEKVVEPIPIQVQQPVEPEQPKVVVTPLQE